MLEAALQSALESVTQALNKVSELSELARLLEALPLADVPHLSLSDYAGNFWKSYEGKHNVSATLDFPEGMAWRDRARVLTRTRKAFGLKEWARSIDKYTGSVSYQGETDTLRIDVHCGKNGLPPTCKIVETEYTVPAHKSTRFETVCE